jgi:diguanylate cyclase (GGDEF)-like protein/excisionase family DNA binding protein
MDANLARETEIDGRATTSSRDGRWLRLGPAAKLLGVSLNTLRRWSDSGDIPCYRSAGGHRRYDRTELQAILSEQRAAETTASEGGGRAAGKARRPRAARHLTRPAVEQLRRHAENLEIVIDAGRQDTSQRDTRKVLQRVVRRLARVTHTPVVDIYAVEDDTLRALVSFDDGRFDRTWEQTRVNLSDFPCSLEAVTKRRIALATSLDDPILTETGRDSLERWGYQAQLAAPLISADRVIGLVELSDYVPRDFADDIDLITGLARVAERALENAVLFEEIEHRNAVLREIVRLGTLATAAGDLRQLLRPVARRLMKALRVADCDIFTSEGDELLSRVSYDRNGYDEAVVGHRLRVDEFAATARALESREIVVLPDLADPTNSPEERKVAEVNGFVSEVCVPLVVDGCAYGVIDIFSDTARDFADDLDFLKSVSQIVAGALQKARLVEQLEEGNRQLGLLVESGLEFSASLQMEEVLSSVAERMRSLVDAESCDVYYLEGDELVTLMSVDRKGRSPRDIGSRYSVGPLTAARTTIAERRPFAIVGAATDPRLTEDDRRFSRDSGMPASVRLPLIVGGKVVGLVGLYDNHPREFEDLELLQGLAQIAAQAVANAKLLEQAEERGAVLRELVDLGAIVWESQDVDELTRTVARRLATTIGVSSCEIFRLRNGLLTVEASYDRRDGFDDSRLGEQLDNERDYPTTFECLARGEVLAIGNPDDPRLTPEERRVYALWGYQSELVVPLVVEGRLVGMIDVFDTEPRRFESSLDFMLSVGQMVAGAFENASLVERLNDTNRELETLVDSGLEFGATLDLDLVLTSVATRIREVAQATCCDIYAIEGSDSRGLVSVDADGADPAFAETLYRLADLNISRTVIETGVPAQVRDCRTDARLTDFERREWLRFGHVSTLRLPLLVGGTVVGFASLYDGQPRVFGSLGLLQGLAQIAAQAVANATLFRKLDRNSQRLQVVNETSLQLTSTLSRRDVLLSTARRLTELGDADCCDIYLLKEGLLECVASFKDGAPALDYEGTTSPLGVWASDKLAIMSRRTIALTGLDDPRRSRDEVEAFRDMPWESQLNVPLIANDKVIGLVELLDRRRERRFSPETIATIEAICRSASLAIDNADLFEQMQARRRETELLNAIARRTAASLKLADIAAATVEELRQIVPFDCAAMAVTAQGGAMRPIYSSESSLMQPEVMAPDAHQQATLETVRRKRVVAWDLGQVSPMGAAHPGEEGMRSGVSVALLRGDELIGVLNLGSTEPEAFTAAHQRLLGRVGTHLSLAINNARLYDEIKDMHLGNLKALSSALNAKDYYTLGHAARVAAYTVLLGHELGWPEEFVQQAEEAAYLHDIGKISVPDRVLVKAAGLNSEEWRHMRQHPVFSADIMRPLFTDEFVLGVRHHHEKWDGGGYPDGLAGEEIPVLARAMCVVDSYDAMSFRRPYRRAYWYPESLAELERCSGAQFDPGMVAAFRRVLGRLGEQRDQARAVAAEAAARIDPAKHALLREPDDERRPEYGEIAAVLREVRDAHPPTRYLTTHAPLGDRQYMMVVDAEEDAERRSRVGSEVHMDEELPAAFAGQVADVNVLYVDEWGVWVTGVAAVTDDQGVPTAVVSADMPPAGADMEGLRSDVAHAFSSLLHTAARRLSKDALEAISDGLTGLYNHRYLHERLSEEIERARETGDRLSVLFCDLDQFKAFNDRHGHSAGDAALRGVSRILEGSIRAIDLAARYGGEEFVVVLLDTDTDGAVEVAERICHDVEKARFLDDPNIEVTVTIGVATFPADADRKENLLDKADWAMYLAKRRGRNRVERFDKSQKTSPVGLVDYAPGQTHLTLMAELVDEKDPYTRRRSRSIYELASLVAQDLDLGAAQVDEVIEAARLCDIGMVGVPDTIFNKPGDLTPEEWALIREHPLTGKRLIDGFGGSDRLAQAIGHHHEHYDGSGYPKGMRGDDIPLPSRIVLAAAAYQALMTRRPFRAAVSSSEALAELQRCAGAQFDPEVVRSLSGVIQTT